MEKLQFKYMRLIRYAMVVKKGPSYIMQFETSSSVISNIDIENQKNNKIKRVLCCAH